MTRIIDYKQSPSQYVAKAECDECGADCTGLFIELTYKVVYGQKVDSTMKTERAGELCWECWKVKHAEQVGVLWKKNILAQTKYHEEKRSGKDSYVNTTEKTK